MSGSSLVQMLFPGRAEAGKAGQPFTPHLLEASWLEGPEVLCCPAAHPAVLVASWLGIKGAV